MGTANVVTERSPSHAILAANVTSLVGPLSLLQVCCTVCCEGICVAVEIYGQLPVCCHNAGLQCHQSPASCLLLLHLHLKACCASFPQSSQAFSHSCTQTNIRGSMYCEDEAQGQLIICKAHDLTCTDTVIALPEVCAVMQQEAKAWYNLLL